MVFCLHCFLYLHFFYEFYIPVIQKELDIFRRTVWNNHRGRKQENKDTTTGVVEHIISFSENYDSESYGKDITEEQR